MGNSEGLDQDTCLCDDRPQPSTGSETEGDGGKARVGDGRKAVLPHHLELGDLLGQGPEDELVEGDTLFSGGLFRCLFQVDREIQGVASHNDIICEVV